MTEVSLTNNAILQADHYVVIVVGALFAIANVGGMMDKTSPGCAIPGQLQCLFCWQVCLFLDVITPSSLRSSSSTSTCCHPCDDALLQVFIFFPPESWYDRNISASLLQLSSIIVFLLLLPIYPHFVFWLSTAHA